MNPLIPESILSENEIQQETYENENENENENVEPVEEVIEEHDVIQHQTTIDDSIAEPRTGFRFMQESELDNEPTSFENGAEWIEKEDALEDSAARNYDTESIGHPVSTIVTTEVRATIYEARRIVHFCLLGNREDYCL